LIEFKNNRQRKPLKRANEKQIQQDFFRRGQGILFRNRSFLLTIAISKINRRRF
jgi:hypothetical protein